MVRAYNEYVIVWIRGIIDTSGKYLNEIRKHVLSLIIWLFILIIVTHVPLQYQAQSGYINMKICCKNMKLLASFKICVSFGSHHYVANIHKPQPDIDLCVCSYWVSIDTFSLADKTEYLPL